MRLSQLQKLIFLSLGLLVLGYGSAMVVIQQSANAAGNEGVTATGVRSLPVPKAEAWPGPDVWAAPQEADHASRASRYELAGTFQIFRTPSGKAESAALVDDREAGAQRIVREGDLLGAFLVGPITEEQLTLQKQGREWILNLTGVTVSRTANQEKEEGFKPVDPADLPALETTRFGKRVKENYWVVERDAVKGYIDEMMEAQNALRTINLYRSFSQVSKQGDENPGFKIGMKGEETFFKDMGLQDGDVIRKANSMIMRTQKRAEYLVREFYNDRMSAVVLDVERDGKIQKHIYLVR